MDMLPTLSEMIGRVPEMDVSTFGSAGNRGTELKFSEDFGEDT